MDIEEVIQIIEEERRPRDILGGHEETVKVLQFIINTIRKQAEPEAP